LAKAETMWSQDSAVEFLLPALERAAEIGEED
jgi:hypothetical protein